MAKNRELSQLGSYLTVNDLNNTVGITTTVIVTTGSFHVGGIEAIKSDGTWGGSSAGIQGIQGIQGVQGTQGIQGIQGIQGVQGVQGTQGIQGTQGSTGSQGTQGSTGSQGTTGTQGISGTATFPTSVQIQSTKANDTATGGGQIYLNGATGNRIDFAVGGFAAPAFTTRSVGSKIVLWPSLDSSNGDYAFGIETSTLWSSVPSSSQQFKWYGGTTNIATLTGGGNFSTASGLRTLEQVRATGWWNTSTGSSYSGLAAEMGVSGGQGYLLCYNRDTSAYGVLNINGASTNIQLPASGTTINVTGSISASGSVSGTNITSGGNVTGSSASLSLSNATISSSSWAGGSGYHGYTYNGGNYRFGFSSGSGVVDVYADGNFYATDSSHLVWHAGNDGSGSNLDADLLDGYQSDQYFALRYQTITVGGNATTWYPVLFSRHAFPTTIYLRKYVHDYQSWDGVLSFILMSHTNSWGGDSGWDKIIYHAYSNRQFIGRITSSPQSNTATIIYLLGGGRNYQASIQPFLSGGATVYLNGVTYEGGTYNPITTADTIATGWQP